MVNGRHDKLTNCSTGIVRIQCYQTKAQRRSPKAVNFSHQQDRIRQGARATPEKRAAHRPNQSCRESSIQSLNAAKAIVYKLKTRPRQIWGYEELLQKLKKSPFPKHAKRYQQQKTEDADPRAAIVRPEKDHSTKDRGLSTSSRETPVIQFKYFQLASGGIIYKL